MCYLHKTYEDLCMVPISILVNNRNQEPSNFAYSGKWNNFLLCNRWINIYLGKRVARYRANTDFESELFRAGAKDKQHTHFVCALQIPFTPKFVFDFTLTLSIVSHTLLQLGRVSSLSRNDKSLQRIWLLMFCTLLMRLCERLFFSPQAERRRKKSLFLKWFSAAVFREVSLYATPLLVCALNSQNTTNISATSLLVCIKKAKNLLKRACPRLTLMLKTFLVRYRWGW